MCGLISSVFKKIIPYSTTPTFQEVGGGTQPLIFWAIRSKFNLRDSISEVSSIFVLSIFGIQFQKLVWFHAREPLYSNSAVIAWWSQSTSGKNGVFMCTLLLKRVINLLILYFWEYFLLIIITYIPSFVSAYQYVCGLSDSQCSALFIQRKCFFSKKKDERFFFVYILKFMLTLYKTLNTMALMCNSLKSVGRALWKLFKYLILYAQFSISGVLAQWSGAPVHSRLD